MFIVHTKASQGSTADYEFLALELNETTGALKSCSAVILESPTTTTGNVGCGAVKSLIATPTGKNFAFGGLDAMPSGMVLDASGAGVNHFDQDSVGGYIWWLADGQTGTAYLCVGTPQAHTINAYACHPENSKC
jgi:hypothetical protein